ncbi:MAG: GIY-YIG nuclease family protein [Ignavibacteria bacterium]|nr:GIY-YIG nuclease family protein [Ignavibacteria bacterium]
MKWYTYILYSKSIDKFYTGHTQILLQRLDRHNSGWGKFSSRGIPWELVYFEEFEEKNTAIKRENEIKRKKSRRYIEELVSKAGGRPD